MAALLAALRADPQIARRRWLRVAAPLALRRRLARSAGAWLAPRARCAPCAGAERKLAGVWDDAAPRRRARRVSRERRALRRGGAAPPSSTTFDGYAHAWAAMHVDACEATHVRGEQSQELLDLRMSCLDDRLTQLKTLSDLDVAADGKAVEHAVQSAQSLPAARLLRRRGRAARADRAAARSATCAARRRRAPDAGARRRARPGRRSTTTALRVRAARRRRGRRAPLRAGRRPRRELRLGQLLDDHGDYADAARALHRALVAALAGHDDAAAAWAAIELIQAIGERQAHYDEGERWAEMAEALVRRLQRKDELLGDAS